MAERKICAVEGCEKPRYVGEFCTAHYQKWRRYGDPLGGWAPKACSVEGCTKRSFCRGYCRPHYERWKRNGDPLGGRHHADNSGKCSVEGCVAQARLLGLCRRHHGRLKRNGEPTGGRYSEVETQRAWIDGVIQHHGDDCIRWPFTVAPNGYGITSVGVAKGAHRVVCILAHGAPPSVDHEVAHSCNDRGCVNPRHLRWATRLENAADKVVHGTLLKGERNPAAKLTADQVIAMRRDRAAGMIYRELAANYGVSICTAHRICRGVAWAWLEPASQPS